MVHNHGILEERVIDADEVADHLRFAFVRHRVDEDVYVCGTEGCIAGEYEKHLLFHREPRDVDDGGAGQRTKGVLYQ